MLIRCWGARGSIPVSGAEYERYGGDTTCIEIRTGSDEVIVIDAGSGIRRLGNRLIREKRLSFHMVFTHVHWDHILGFPFFKPVYMRESSLRIFGCSYTRESIQGLLSRTMQSPYFPIEFADLRADLSYQEICGGPFPIHSITVTPIPLSHPNRGMGYKFEEDGQSFVFLTDNELGYKHPGGLDFQDYVEHCRGADLLIHDAEFTSEEYPSTRSWGHSVVPDALRLATEAGVKRFGIFHHNQERVDERMDQIVEDCRRIIRDRGVAMECFALTQETEIQL
jgi:phosphoribosyl 1,2-cyclic phosphodiesterase